MSNDQNQAQRAVFDTERTVSAPFSGTFQTLGSPLTHNPVIIIFDNQSSVAVALSVDGVNTWKTFTSGEAMLLDMRSNRGSAPTYTIDKGTQFFALGSAGTGLFSIAILYAK